MAGHPKENGPLTHNATLQPGQEGCYPEQGPPITHTYTPHTQSKREPLGHSGCDPRAVTVSPVTLNTLLTNTVRLTATPLLIFCSVSSKPKVLLHKGLRGQGSCSCPCGGGALALEAPLSVGRVLASGAPWVKIDKRLNLSDTSTKTASEDSFCA